MVYNESNPVMRSTAVLYYKFEVLYLGISISCYFILLLHYIFEENIVLFTPNIISGVQWVLLLKHSIQHLSWSIFSVLLLLLLEYRIEILPPHHSICYSGQKHKKRYYSWNSSLTWIHSDTCNFTMCFEIIFRVTSLKWNKKQKLSLMSWYPYYFPHFFPT